jgi:hypothetical protein
LEIVVLLLYGQKFAVTTTSDNDLEVNEKTSAVMPSKDARRYRAVCSN